MEVKSFHLYMHIGPIQFQFVRDEATKKWTFIEKNVVVKPANLDETIDIMETVIKFIKILDAGATEVDNLNTIANNFREEPAA